MHKSSILAGIIGLVGSAALQVGQPRTALVSATTAALGRSVNQDYWEAMLRLASFGIAAFSILLIVYSSPRRRLATRRYFARLASTDGGEHDNAARRRLIYTVIAALGIGLVVTAQANRLSTYNTDSWAYFELSKTVFGEEFYRFNTFRSYYSDPYSTSFPLGYPVLLSLLQLLFGPNPVIGVWVNVAFALATWLLIVRIAGQLRLSPLVGWAIASTLLLWSFYLEEVFSGRSIPAALFLFLAAATFVLSRKPLLGGIVLGLSALVRFDYLAFAILFQCAILVFRFRHDRRLALLPTGFLVGISPWVAYSLVHFGRLWVSDSSWIALSASPAYVVDFPAAAASSAFQQPAMWLARVAGNVVPLAASVLSAVVTFPLLLALGFLLVVRWSRLDKIGRRRIVVLSVLLLASMGPLLLTGYTDKRYFSLFFLSASALLAYCLESRFQTQPPPPAYVPLILISMVFSLTLAVVNLSKLTWFGWQLDGTPDPEASKIELLRACSTGAAPPTYIFMGNDIFAARYGAITGQPSAFIPSNFSRMTPIGRQAYFDRMKPFIVVDNPMELEGCPLPQ